MNHSRRAAILVALSNLFPQSASAHPRHYQYRWSTRRRIVVENKLGPEWNETVRVQAAAWRRAYPKLRFKVIHKPGRCRWRKGAIVICQQAIPDAYAAWADTRRKGREITKVRIEVQNPTYVSAGLLCHEFGHALGLKHNQAGSESCVGGTTVTASTPGPYDRRSLRRLYRKRGKRWP